MTVKEAMAQLQKAMEQGYGDAEFIIAIRTAEDGWLEAQVDGVEFDQEHADQGETTVVAAGETRRQTYYSRGLAEREEWHTWEDDMAAE